MKQQLIKCSKKAGVILITLILLLIPIFSYILFEYVTGNIGSISIYWSVFNIILIYLLYLVAFAITGSTRLAIPSISIFLFALSAAEYMVVMFRDRPIMFWDILAFQTAVSVAGNYELIVTKEMYLAFLGIQIICLLAIIFPKKIKAKKQRVVFAGGTAVIVLSIGVWFYSYLIPSKGLGINSWEVNETYQEYGYVLSTAVSCSYAVKKKPEGYSISKVNQIYESINEENQLLLASNCDVKADAKSVDTPVNIICIMNESFSDLKTAGEFETNEEYFPFLNSLKENTIRGSLCVPVFGSMTSNSEFEFLTGDSTALLPRNSIAYQFNVKANTYSLISTLEAQGYQTLAMHPYPGKNWNREECYRNMGVDEFQDIQYYEDSDQLRNYVSDQADYEKLIERVESKENPSDKLFIFNVTMQNHGGYDTTFDNFNQDIWLTGAMQGKYPETDQYLSLMKRSDEALQYLISYFQQNDEPTMIVLFGDHQPSVENEFFDEIAGTSSDQIPDEKHLMWYETPFFIWTNYQMNSEEKGKMGAIYLAPELLKRAGLQMSPYQQFLLKMEETYPVVHPLGVYDKNGKYYTWSEAEENNEPGGELINQYEYLVYNQLFDRKILKKMFTLEADISVP